jgi:3-phenylpropionate/trans-cinnamate dioxygenase ferredoxin subunit
VTDASRTNTAAQPTSAEMADMAQERVGAAGDMAPGELRCLKVGGLPICLVRAGDGNFYAVEDRCSHEDTPLSEGWVDGTEIECAAHNAMFDLRTGEATSLPAIEPIRTFPVQVRDDGVYVTVDAEASAG